MTSSLPPETRRKRWTRAEFDRAREILHQRRLELVQGDVIDKKCESWPHLSSKLQIFDWLASTFGPYLINQTASIDVAPEDNAANEPEPDLIVLNRDLREFKEANPGPQDLQLVIEVADDSTLGFDFHTKGALYARAGIVEYWLLDIAGRRMIVHREPQEGRYRSRVAYSEEENLAPLAAPAAFLKVADAFAV